MASRIRGTSTTESTAAILQEVNCTLYWLAARKQASQSPARAWFVWLFRAVELCSVLQVSFLAFFFDPRLVFITTFIIQYGFAVERTKHDSQVDRFVAPFLCPMSLVFPLNFSLMGFDAAQQPAIAWYVWTTCRSVICIVLLVLQESKDDSSVFKFVCRKEIVDPCPPPGMPGWVPCNVDVSWYMYCLKKHTNLFGLNSCDSIVLMCGLYRLSDQAFEGSLLALYSVYSALFFSRAMMVLSCALPILSIVASLAFRQCLWALPADDDAIDRIEDREKSFHENIPVMSNVHIFKKFAMDHVHLVACIVNAIVFFRVGLKVIASCYGVILALALARTTYHGNRPCEEFCVARRGLELGLVTNTHIGIYRDTRDILSFPGVVLSVYGFPYLISSPLSCIILELTIAAKCVGLVNYVWYSIDLNALRPKPVRTAGEAIEMTIRNVGTVAGIEMMRW